MPFKRRFKDKYAGSSPENASVVRTLFDLFVCSGQWFSWEEEQLINSASLKPVVDLLWIFFSEREILQPFWKLKITTGFKNSLKKISSIYFTHVDHILMSFFSVDVFLVILHRLIICINFPPYISAITRPSTEVVVLKTTCKRVIGCDYASL